MPKYNERPAGLAKEMAKQSKNKNLQKSVGEIEKAIPVLKVDKVPIPTPKFDIDDVVWTTRRDYTECKCKTCGQTNYRLKYKVVCEEVAITSVSINYGLY